MRQFAARKEPMSEKFTVKFVDNKNELLAAERLRYQMVTEYNSDAVNEQHTDYSSVDEQALHIIATDNESGEVVGYYRMLTTEAVGDGKFICEDEYNIDELKRRGEKMCELSRAIVKKEYRGGVVVMMLWKFILNFALDNGYRYLIGDVSFNGTDRNEFLQEVSYLANNFGIDESYKITSRDVLEPMELLDESQYDKGEVRRKLPPLFKAYTQIGGRLSSQTFTDTAFGSVDLFVLVDLQNCNMPYIKRLIAQR